MNGFGPAPEPGLEHFVQWLDHQLRRSPDTRAGILGAIMGTSWGLGGAGVGVLAGVFTMPAPWVLTPLALALAANIGGLFWYFKGRSEEERVLRDSMAEARGLLWKLQKARVKGHLGQSLGEAKPLLEEAARHWVLARACFQSPIWNASGAGAHAEAREHGLRAMDAAMNRLVLLAGFGSFDASPEGQPVRLVEDMRQISAEAKRLAERLGKRTLAGESDASRELRAALGELRMLSSAEQELSELKAEEQ
jgi:hypothetical protein